MRLEREIKFNFRTLLTFIFILLAAVSCMKDAPDSLPDRVEWNPELAFPLGENRYDLFDVTGFDSSMIDLDTVTGLPQWVDTVVPFEVVMEGELEMDLTAILENIDQINGILFRANFENSYPDEIYTQGYFRDPGGLDLDSMFTEGPVPVPPALVRQNGELVRTGKTQQDAYFNKDRIIALEEADRLYLKAFFLVTDPDSALIPYYPEFWFDAQLGAMFDLSIEF